MKRILAVVVSSLVVLVLFTCAVLAQEKAVRRSSQESGILPTAQKRVALVIGNSDYKVRPLQNPANDANDISAVLRSLGFSVHTKINVDHRQMEDAVNRFVQEIQDGDVALFYFSGHGVQVKGENYLIPLDDSIQMEADVRFKTLNASLVLGKMEEARNRTNIVILDACRNNPFKGAFRSASSGLSKMDAPKGTLIAYATSPDSVAADGTGRNSPYTKHLLEALKMKDIPIELAFKNVARGVNKETGGQQTPWISSSLLDDFYCNPSSPSHWQEASLPPSTSSRPATGQASLERREASDPCDDYIQKAQRLVAAFDENLKRRNMIDVHHLNQMCHESEVTECLVPYFRKTAEQGDVRGQTFLGYVNINGLGVAKDVNEAAKWYRKAANGGSIWAQYWLGRFYEDLGKIPKDVKQAVEWYKQAAEQGCTDAQLALGKIYWNGEEVPKDYAEAVKWYREAAEKGLVDGFYPLGLAYELGVGGVRKSREEAIKWYRKAAEKGNPFVYPGKDARERLQKMGVSPQAPDKAAAKPVAKPPTQKLP